MTSSTEIQQIYTKKADLYHKVFFDVLKYDKAVKSFFEKENYLDKDCKVLDAGCGSGLITKILVGISKQKNFLEFLFMHLILQKEC